MIVETDCNKVERRRGPDFLLKLIHWIAISGWVLMLVGLILFGKAKPQSPSFFDRLMKVPIKSNWDQGLIQNIIILMLVILSSCTIGLLINSQRIKRRDDHFNYSLIILGVVAGFVILLFLFYLRDQLSFL